MKIILVAIDFSRTSLLALEYAAYFAHQLQYQLHLIHICEANPHQPIPDAPSKDKAKQLEAAQLFLENIAKRSEGIRQYQLRVQHHVRYGFPIEQIQLVHKAINAQVLVMGTLGQHAQKEDYLIGHVAYEFAQLVPNTLLLVPPAATTPHLHRLLFLDEGQTTTQPYPKCVNHYLNKHAINPYKAQLTISQPKQKVAQQAQVAYFTEDPMTSEKALILSHQNMPQSLFSFARHHAIDMVCIYGDRYLRYYLLHQNLRHPQQSILNQVPLLLIHASFT